MSKEIYRYIQIAEQFKTDTQALTESVQPVSEQLVVGLDIAKRAKSPVPFSPAPEEPKQNTSLPVAN